MSRSSDYSKQKTRSRPKRVAGFAEPADEIIVGRITHYYPRVKAGVIKLKRALSVGDRIYIRGQTTDVQQAVSSLELNHRPIRTGKRGQAIGLLMKKRVRPHDTVYWLKRAQ